MEDTLTGELVGFPGAWSFLLGKSAVILVTDDELVAISEDPDRVLDLSLTYEKHEASLRQVCERARDAGHPTLIVAYDHFFHQYRPGQFAPRRLTPDSDEAIRRLGAVSRFAAEYGLGLELSLLSPLEIGPAYAKATGESGRWMHYRKGVRDPKTGAYGVDLWRQKRWANNKGVIDLEPTGVRVFAFAERPIPGTTLSVVDPERIVEITDGARCDVVVDEPNHARVRIHGVSDPSLGDLDRVLVVQLYRTPEMDYFSENALPYLTDLCDRYVDAGVRLNALYSDELHIQQDWIYADHHDHGQLALRYVSPGLERAFAARHGERYADFGRWLVYFCIGQEDWRHDLSAGEAVQHVWGDTPEAIRETALFRANYYRLLQDGVVDLFADAKRHLERRLGKTLEARAHATWAESPTIDFWRKGPRPMYQGAYEYTPDFLWSNTVHQASAACHDYFKWADFLTASGNDHCECGWADRNYVGIALACSIALVTEIPSAYAAHWGMPDALARRRMALVNASGCAGSPVAAMVQGMEHRATDVLFLYPLDLVALDERFGSWTAQYGYADFLTQDALLARGSVRDGAVVVRGRRYTTVVATCEPFPRPGLLEMLRALADGGGTVVWSGPAPVLGVDGAPARAAWEDLFGVRADPVWIDGYPAPGRQVVFEGLLGHLPPQTILTDFPVDRVHPVTPGADARTLARVPHGVVGTLRPVGAGQAVYLGFRPRDDQSASLGYESRHWFEILRALGGHAGDDDPQALSRTTDWFCCAFPNGAVGVAPHFRRTEEDWQGGFGRDAAADGAYLERCPPPSETIALEGFRIAGRRIDYRGHGWMTVRPDAAGVPVAFAGQGCDRIAVDGVETVFADAPVEEIGWAPVPPEARVDGGAVLRLWCRGAATLSIPVDADGALAVVAEGASPGSRGEALEARRDGGRLVVTVEAAHAGRWLYAVPA